jgi:hypothetical protein
VYAPSIVQYDTFESPRILCSNRLVRKVRDCPGSIYVGTPMCIAVYGSYFPRQQFLYFLPLPQGHGSLRPSLLPARTIGLALPEAASW